MPAPAVARFDCIVAAPATVALYAFMLVFVAKFSVPELSKRLAPAAPKAAELLRVRMPAFKVVPPVKVLALERIQVPLSFFVTLPEVVPMILAIEPPCAPPTVKPKVAPVIVPVLLMFIAPVPPTILLALPKVSNPLYVAAAPEFINAPPLEIPVPLIVSVSAVPNVNPFKSRVAPEVTEVPAPTPATPSGVLAPPPVAPSRNVPALMVVNPEYVFELDGI